MNLKDDKINMAELENMMTIWIRTNCSGIPESYWSDLENLVWEYLETFTTKIHARLQSWII